MYMNTDHQNYHSDSLPITFEVLTRLLSSFGILIGNIFMPPDRMIGGILFCPVCLSVVNLNLPYNF